MSAPAIAIPPARAPRSGASPEVLAECLESERDLLLNLLGVLKQQRGAVATDDLAVLDDTVFATHRLLGTYREAQQRRRRVAGLLAGSGDVSLASLDEALGPRMTDRLRRARTELRAAADSLRAEMSANRSLLQRAAASGDSILRTVARAAGPSRPVATGHAGYSGGAVTQADGGTFLDFRA